jgi:hypothetical protein
MAEEVARIDHNSDLARLMAVRRTRCQIQEGNWDWMDSAVKGNSGLTHRDYCWDSGSYMACFLKCGETCSPTLFVSVSSLLMYLSGTTSRSHVTAHRTDCSVYGLSQARDLVPCKLLDERVLSTASHKANRESGLGRERFYRRERFTEEPKNTLPLSTYSAGILPSFRQKSKH